jgi:hypothetical protein
MSDHFLSDVLRPIDVPAAVRAQWGEFAQPHPLGDHLFDWRAEVGGELRGIDLNAAAAAQWGEDHRLVSVGMQRGDWRAVSFDALEKTIVPVMLIASDLLHADVRPAIERFRSVIANVGNWYALRVGKRFRVLQPLVLPSTRDALTWNGLSVASDTGDHRWEMYQSGVGEVQLVLSRRHPSTIFLIAPFTGEGEAYWLGAGEFDGYVVVPPRATSVDCPPSGPLDEVQSDAAYAMAHELGHAFGLKHTSEAFPGSGDAPNALMDGRKLPDAILLQEEVQLLRSSGFFDGRRRPARPVG